MAQTRVAFQCATDARITIIAFYGRNSHFLCFGENLSQTLMEKNVKFILNDAKATVFSGSKRRDIRASILVPLASHKTLQKDVLQHPDLKLLLYDKISWIFAQIIELSAFKLYQLQI